MRYEIIEYLGNLRSVTVFIPEILNYINDIENVFNSNAKEIMEYYTDYSFKDKLPDSSFSNFKIKYLEKERLLKNKLNEIAIELLDDYKKTP